MDENQISGKQPLPANGEIDFGLDAPRAEKPQETPSNPPEVAKDAAQAAPMEDTSKANQAEDKADKSQKLVVDVLKREKPEEAPKLTHEQTLHKMVNDVLRSDDGKATAEQLELLKQSGFSEKTLNTLVHATRVERQANDQEVFELVGGREVYQEMAAHAVQEYSDEQLEAFNHALKSGNKSLARLAILGLKADYETANTSKTPQERIGGGNTTGNTGTGFQSQQEVIDAMRDFRYGNDPAYTKEVDSKRSKTNW